MCNSLTRSDTMNNSVIFKHLSNHIFFRFLQYSLIALQLRESLGKRKSHRAAEWHPLALWLSNILLTYAGDMLGSLLVGSLPLEAFCDASDVFLCTIVWYLMFYCPLDLSYKVARTAPFQILATTISALSQMLLIDRGVQAAGKVYDNAVLPMVLVGAVMGSGAELMNPVTALLMNKFQKNNYNKIKLTTNSKLALCIALLFALKVNRQLLLHLTCYQLQTYILVALITYKYMSMAYCTDDTL